MDTNEHPHEEWANLILTTAQVLAGVVGRKAPGAPGLMQLQLALAPFDHGASTQAYSHKPGCPVLTAACDAECTCGAWDKIADARQAPLAPRELRDRGHFLAEHWPAIAEAQMLDAIDIGVKAWTESDSADDADTWAFLRTLWERDFLVARVSQMREIADLIGWKPGGPITLVDALKVKLNGGSPIKLKEATNTTMDLIASWSPFDAILHPEDGYTVSALGRFPQCALTPPMPYEHAMCIAVALTQWAQDRKKGAAPSELPRLTPSIAALDDDMLAALRLLARRGEVSARDAPEYEALRERGYAARRAGKAAFLYSITAAGRDALEGAS